MAETLNVLFQRCDDGNFEIQVRESWSGRTVTGPFQPPYTSRQLNALHKKLNTLESEYQELCAIGQRLYQALCGQVEKSESTSGELSVWGMLRSVIQRTLRRRGTVALLLCFGPGCDEFIRYPWELLHNGTHFLLVSGLFTLTRAIQRPDMPMGCELPVQPPFRVLYIGASPCDCEPLETERSFHALEQGLTSLLETEQVLLDRLEPPTFDQLVRYLNSYGGAGLIEESDTVLPCYVVHFDGHGAYGRLCPEDECETVNEADARKCRACGRSLARVKAQTYLCFNDEHGYNRYIDTQSLRDLFLSSDVRLVVLSACETALLTGKQERKEHKTVIDATLATALVTAQVPAVVAMPFSLQDDLSPTFMFHFYEALADGRTLEEALSRARQAMQQGWFVPVLYRHVNAGEEGPVALLTERDDTDEQHILAHLGAATTFVGRARELQDVSILLTALATGQQGVTLSNGLRLRSGMHHIALTGSAGIGKSALIFEAVRLNQGKFPGGVIGVSLQGGKTFVDALREMIVALHIPMRNVSTTDDKQLARQVTGAFHALANRELPSLLLLDGFEEIKERGEQKRWLQFLSALPVECAVLITSRSNPENVLPGEVQQCRWYEYPVRKMMHSDLLILFAELAAENGLDQRIQLADSRQQAILQEICTLLDGYPLGAELIFGTARDIDGKVFTPEAATRSLEEVRDELRNTPLAGMFAALEVSYRHLTPQARILLSYLATFKLPFRSEQIRMVLALKEAESTESSALTLLAQQWRVARDELVRASFLYFDGNVYTMHAQIRAFALAYLPLEERRRIYRAVASYYAQLPQPTFDEWLAAFEHLESAGEPQDMREAVRVAIQASWALSSQGGTRALLVLLRRASLHASRLAEKHWEGRIHCALGAVLRRLGEYAEAEVHLRRSLELYQQTQAQEDVGWACYELAIVQHELGNLQQAEEQAQAALPLFQRAEVKKGELWTSLLLSSVLRDSGRYHQAQQFVEAALSGFRLLNEQAGLALALHNRGRLAVLQGQYAKAQAMYDEALRLANEQALQSARAWLLDGKANLAFELARLEDAESLTGEALALFQNLGQRRGEGQILLLSGNILRARNQPLQARSRSEEAHEIFIALGDRINEARSLVALGTLSHAEGDYLAAKEAYEQAQMQAHEQGARSVESQAWQGLGDCALMLGQFAEAEYYYNKAQTLADELESVMERVAVLRRLGQLKLATQDYAAALSSWLQALTLDPRSTHPARAELQERIITLVAEHSLQDRYQQLSKR